MCCAFNLQISTIGGKQLLALLNGGVHTCFPSGSWREGVATLIQVELKGKAGLKLGTGRGDKRQCLGGCQGEASGNYRG